MGYKINELKDYQIKELKEKHPQGTFHKYQVADGIYSLSYHETYEEAKIELRKWEGIDVLTSKMDEFRDEMVELGERYGIDQAEIMKMIRYQ